MSGDSLKLYGSAWQLAALVHILLSKASVSSRRSVFQYVKIDFRVFGEEQGLAGASVED